MPWKTIYREKYKFTKNAHKTECDLAPKTLQEVCKTSQYETFKPCYR